MNLNEYDKLRSKKNKKDFEGRNKEMNRWIYLISYLGNIGSIFFASFYLYPALLKVLSVHLSNEFVYNLISITITVLVLAIFELLKRYTIKIFALEYYNNKKKFNSSIIGLLVITSTVVLISIYLALSGSVNLASTSNEKNVLVEKDISIQIDSAVKFADNEKLHYVIDNNRLREINNNLRVKLLETPTAYRVVRSEYQDNVDKNIGVINNNNELIKKIEDDLKLKIEKINNNLHLKKNVNADDDFWLIILFVVLTIVDELLIIAGIYFREYYENKLFELNHQKYEKFYQKRERYKALLAFVYNNGKAIPGDKVLSGIELKEVLIDKTNITGSNKLVDTFLSDMDRLNVFVTNGKRRHIAATYSDAIDIIENIDDAYYVIENMK